MDGEEREARLHLIGQTIFDKKGFNILALDVRGVCSLTDTFFFAEGSADKHVKAIAQEVMRVLKAEGEKPLHVEGLSDGDWVVLDYLDVVIHLFKPGVRDKYRLEELWQEGRVIELNIVVSSEVSLGREF